MRNETHLRPRVEYEEMYDHITVDTCRDIEQRFLSYKFKPDEKTKKLPTKKEQKAAVQVATELRLMWEIGERYSKKEQVIKEWIESDRAKDDLLESAELPKRINCQECGDKMEVGLKTLYDLHDSPERVLFFFDCADCNVKRAVFENGEELERKSENCPTCGEELSENVTRKRDVITAVFNCSNCQHTHTDEFEVGVKKKKMEPNFEKDRKRFCPTGKRAERYVQGVESMRGIAQLNKEIKQQDKDKPFRDEIKKMTKLSVPQLEKCLIDALEETGYVKLELTTPEIDQQVVVSFSIQDGQVDREEKSSVHKLQRIIRLTLKDTNWRLMSGGIEYRLGVLTGRIKGYDRDEDMMKLAKQRLKDRNQAIGT